MGVMKESLRSHHSRLKSFTLGIHLIVPDSWTFRPLRRTRRVPGEVDREGGAGGGGRVRGGRVCLCGRERGLSAHREEDSSAIARSDTSLERGSMGEGNEG